MSASSARDIYRPTVLYTEGLGVGLVPLLSLGAVLPRVLYWKCGNCQLPHYVRYNAGWAGDGRPSITRCCNRCDAYNEEPQPDLDEEPWLEGITEGDIL